MNTNRIITWGIFIVMIGLIIWGMIAASQKANRDNSSALLVTQISDSDWVKGNATSTVTIVEYSDFQCPACASYYPLIEKVIAENSDRASLVFRNFPLPQHKNAKIAAQAAGAAGLQGKFWEMHDRIFATQTDWENSTDAKNIFKGYAEKLGLDMEKYTTDADSKEVSDKIDADLSGGIKAGVNSTPTFYINGKKIESPQSVQEFNKLINEAASTTIKS